MTKHLVDRLPVEGKIHFSPRQKKIFILCFFAYASSYVARSNLAIAITPMSIELGVTHAQASLMSTGFFWAYAVGQIISGILGDKYSSKVLVSIGMLGAAASNFFVGSSTNISLIICLWSLNGLFLAMFWSPIVKVFSFWYDATQRNSVSVGISTSMVAGYFLSWGVSGIIVSFTSWRWAFWFASIVLVSYCLIWLRYMKDKPQDAGIEPISASNVNVSVQGTDIVDEKAGNTEILNLFFKGGLVLIALVCIFQGAVRESVSLWTPSLLLDAGQGNISGMLSNIIAISTPVFSLGGIFFVGYINKACHYKEKISLSVLCVSAFASCVGLYFGKDNYVLLIICLGMICAMLFGSGVILTGIIPLKFGGSKSAAVISGVLNFFCYVGAAFGSFITGWLVDNFGWSGVFVFWIVLSILPIICVTFFKVRE